MPVPDASNRRRALLLTHSRNPRTGLTTVRRPWHPLNLRDAYWRVRYWIWGKRGY